MSKQSVVVTGSTRGLGFALADAFLDTDCAVMVSGRDGRAVGECVDRLRAKHTNASVEGTPADMSRIEDAEALFLAAKDAFGRVDLWINNAGLGGRAVPLVDKKAPDVGAVVGANLTGTMNGCVVALAGMQAQGSGQIFNTEGFGSDGMKRDGMAIYGATKQAVRYFTRSIVKELAGGPVLIGTIVPGLIVSDMLVEQYKAASPRRRGLYAAAADLPETIAANLAPRLLGNRKHGAVVAWLTPLDLVGRLVQPKYKKRGLFASRT